MACSCQQRFIENLFCRGCWVWDAVGSVSRVLWPLTLLFAALLCSEALGAHVPTLLHTPSSSRACTSSASLLPSNLAAGAGHVHAAGWSQPGGHEDAE